MHIDGQKKRDIVVELSGPPRDRYALLRLGVGLIKALRSRERLLPNAILRQNVDSILKKREILLESVRRFKTPQYFYDEPSVSKRLWQFENAFSRYLERYRAFYALKSNSFVGICRRAVAAGMGLEVSSGFELSKALAVGCEHIIFGGPGKTDEELLLAIQNRKNVTLLMDSFGELGRLSGILKREGTHKNSLKVGVRVRSDHREVWNKFGIPLKDLGIMLKKAAALKGVEPCGIQFHTSWNLGPSSHVAMINKIGSHIRQHLPRDLWKSIKFLDIGGGFWPEQGEWLNPAHTLKGRIGRLLDPAFSFSPAHYYHKASSIDHFAKEIGRALLRQGPPLCHLEIWTEPGRWISNSSMHILLTVIDKKDFLTVVTDGGTNLLGWERPLTEFIPVINISRPALTERYVRIFGSLCTPYDVWGTSVFGDGILPDDTLVIPDQGAYTYSLRQSFIKPRSKVISYDGTYLEEVEKEETAH